MLKIFKANLKKHLSKKCFYTTDAVLTDLKYVKCVQDGIIKHIRPFKNIDLLPAQLDWQYLLDKKNVNQIENNVKNRKGVGEINLLVSILILILSKFFLKKLFFDQKSMIHSKN